MIIINDKYHGEIIAKAAGALFHPTDVCISREKNGLLLGGSIFTGHTGHSIGMHVASFYPNWITRNLIFATFYYPFVQLELAKVIGTVPETNLRALEFDLALGFKEETRIKHAFKDGDMIILGMYKADCRWIRMQPRLKMSDIEVRG